MGTVVTQGHCGISEKIGPHDLSSRRGLRCVGTMMTPDAEERVHFMSVDVDALRYVGLKAS